MGDNSGFYVAIVAGVLCLTIGNSCGSAVAKDNQRNALLRDGWKVEKVESAEACEQQYNIYRWEDGAWIQCP